MNDKLVAKNNITWFNGYLTREDREKLHGHKGAVIWSTGISAPYESPENPDLVNHSHQEDPMESAQQVLDLIKERQII